MPITILVTVGLFDGFNRLWGSLRKCSGRLDDYITLSGRYGRGNTPLVYVLCVASHATCFFALPIAKKKYVLLPFLGRQVLQNQT